MECVSALKLGGNCASSAPSLPAFASGSIARLNSSTSDLIDRRERLQQRALRARRALQRRLLEHLRVRELLIQLERELEVRSACARPSSS